MSTFRHVLEGIASLVRSSEEPMRGSSILVPILYISGRFSCFCMSRHFVGPLHHSQELMCLGSKTRFHEKKLGTLARNCRQNVLNDVWHYMRAFIGHSCDNQGDFGHTSNKVYHKTRQWI